MPENDHREKASATRQAIADLVRSAREERGLSQEELGRLINYSGAAISKLETCKDGVTLKMLSLLDRVLFDGRKILVTLLPYLDVDLFPPHFRDYALIERDALSISAYQNMVMDGPFQTEAYAMAVIKGAYPALTSDAAERFVQARMTRQALFDRTDPMPHLELVQEESTLMRQFGTRLTMRDQLLHLAELSRRPNVTVQVLPMACGARGEHAGTEGPTKLFERADHSRVVYLEVQRRGMLISQAEEVSEMTQRYAMIRAQALDPYESRDLILRKAEEFK
ncbi:helix-turn-helix transcriptional regulator [Streptomyces sp. JJ66]|uniref:helix-turn-helix domain-containing protein n=1 Tax=Streptomyces sp. JJ66 TaxID=2803843 RepID=UPI001C5653A0|nr:helix-turn-helix transcriptional regulator [Streptomyces sp. JJ66]MBW1601526.1 helix-turn-helix transcriptional regulator [Streptomyces sp. JJ66]